MAEIREHKKEAEKSEPKTGKASKSATTKKPTAPSSPKATSGQGKAPVKAKKAQGETTQGFAVIETGGKQYRVSVGDTIKIEKIKGEMKEGDSVVFDKVLLVDNGTDSTDLGTPYVAGAKVTGTLSEIGRNKKVIVLKYKQKSRYLKKNGHRQPYFKIKIEKIS